MNCTRHLALIGGGISGLSCATALQHAGLRVSVFDKTESTAAKYPEHSAQTAHLDSIYGASHWTRAALHEWRATLRPPYVIDTNRDTQLLDSYAGTPHVLIHGSARLGGTDHRFRLYALDGS
ncbi:MAG TPA: NAD(P)-binding protein, partial [Candidatus Accumulibacter phosphatis]|nr:NAD(P)-binding protein [Candidatus Accumulibacter phosphatis]